jgi:flagellar biosynthetic protein FliQ
MTPDTVLSVGEQALQVTVMLGAPLLLSALAIGLIISVVQAATQINEMTLTFIPKLLALVAVIYLAGPWMLTLIVGFSRRLFERMPGLLG